MPEYFYRGQPLSSYSLWDLGLIEKSIKEAIAKREEASNHPKFNTDRNDNGKTIKKILFPSPNIEFLKLKDAVETEIKNRQELQAQKAKQVN